MSLRSVPDARRPVPVLWWVPVIAILVLGSTTVAILPSDHPLTELTIAVVVSLAGYGAVWWAIRPGPLRTGPYPRTPRLAPPMDRSDPPTQPIPIVPTRPGGGTRAARLLLNSAAVALGLSAGWSLVVGLVLRPPLQHILLSRSVFGGVVRAIVNALATSILEECGIAILILAVAGSAERFLPSRWDSRSVAVTAILTATVVRTLLHIPAWGIGAVARIGLSFVLAWLFWRTRRIWPLIVAHLCWDTLALQAVISPSAIVRANSALAILGWGAAGVVLGIIAMARSRRTLQGTDRV